MHIVNAMFGRGLGGIEQAFFDYSEALIGEGHEVTALLRDRSAMIPHMESLSKKSATFKFIPLCNLGFWDMLAVLRLKRRLSLLKPDAIITHGNRAATLLRAAAGNKIPVISLAHNYSVKRLVGSTAIFAITKDIARACTDAGQPQEQVHIVPNMIRSPESVPAHKPIFRDPVVIGTMGRFVAKKGFADFIEALGILKAKNVPFKALLGGDGEEKENLKKLASQHDLEEHLSFIGWVKDKREFFESIDIFCLPSLHEPFGIVLLEAFAHGVPVITSDSEGPSEIASHGRDALVVPKGDAKALADSISTLLGDPVVAERLATGGLETVRTKYDMKVVAALIEDELQKIVSLNRRAA